MECIWRKYAAYLLPLRIQISSRIRKSNGMIQRVLYRLQTEPVMAYPLPVYETVCAIYSTQIYSEHVYSSVSLRIVLTCRILNHYCLYFWYSVFQIFRLLKIAVCLPINPRTDRTNGIFNSYLSHLLNVSYFNSNYVEIYVFVWLNL
jgi:hypothetical protein